MVSVSLLFIMNVSLILDSEVTFLEIVSVSFVILLEARVLVLFMLFLFLLDTMFLDGESLHLGHMYFLRYLCSASESNMASMSQS